MTRLAPQPTRLTGAVRSTTSAARWRGIDAVTFLSIYLLLLLALPSSLTITVLGSGGRPAGLWAAGGALWWTWIQVQRYTRSRAAPRAVRITLFVFVGVILVGYAWALLRGLPYEEISPADNALIRLTGWIGLALIASEGIDDPARFRVLLRRIVVAGALMATLGLLQFMTGESLLDWIQIPGFSSNMSGLAGVDLRGGFVRASGTAIHPLEYGVVLCVAIPIAISLALEDVGRSRVMRWIPVLVTSTAAVLAVSRSTLVGLAAGLLVLVPAWTRRVRILFGVAAVFMIIAISALVPGIIGTLRGLFIGVGEGDPSTTSRVQGYDSAVEFMSRYPVFGKGFGTFLPNYRILDNAYLLLAIELGVIGLAAFLALLWASAWSASRARRLFADPLDRALAQSLLASMVAGAVLLAFFDGLSFPISSGMFFLVIGLCSGALRLAQWESGHVLRTG